MHRCSSLQGCLSVDMGEDARHSIGTCDFDVRRLDGTVVRTLVKGIAWPDVDLCRWELRRPMLLLFAKDNKTLFEVGRWFREQDRRVRECLTQFGIEWGELFFPASKRCGRRRSWCLPLREVSGLRRCLAS